MNIYCNIEYLPLLLGLLDNQETALIKYMGFPYNCYQVVSGDINQEMLCDEQSTSTWTETETPFYKRGVVIQDAINLLDSGEEKIAVLKMIKRRLGIGLKEAWEIVRKEIE